MGVFVNRIIKVLGDQVHYGKEEEGFVGGTVAGIDRPAVLSFENFDMNSSIGIFN